MLYSTVSSDIVKGNPYTTCTYTMFENRFSANIYDKFSLDATCNRELGIGKLDYSKIVSNFFAPEDKWDNVYPMIIPGWDRTPRAGNSEGIYVNSTPENFKKHIEQALNIIDTKPQEHKILFLKSWNEWGEGNYVEPDLKYGHAYLDAIKENIL